MRRVFWVLLFCLLPTAAGAQTTTRTADVFRVLGGPCDISAGSGAASGGANCDLYAKADGTLWQRAGGSWFQLVPSSLTVGGHALTGNVTLAKGDVGLGNVDNVSFGSVSMDLVPDLADTRSLGSAAKPWKAGYVSTFYSVLLAQQTQAVMGGPTMYTTSSGAFAAAVGSADTTIDFGQTMTANAFVKVQALDTGGVAKTEYIKVISQVGVTTVYNVERDKAGAHVTDPAWPMGTPYAVYGPDGTYRFVLDPSVPSFTIRKQGSTYNATTNPLTIDNTGITLHSINSVLPEYQFKFYKADANGSFGIGSETASTSERTIKIDTTVSVTDHATGRATNSIIASAPWSGSNHQASLSVESDGTAGTNATTIALTADNLIVNTAPVNFGAWVNGALTYTGGYADQFYGSASMTWQVQSGDIATYRYVLLGKTMLISIRVSTTTVGGTRNSIFYAKIPGSKTAASNMDGTCWAYDNGTGIGAVWSSTAASTLISIQPTNLAAWSASTDNTQVRCSIAVEIQ